MPVHECSGYAPHVVALHFRGLRRVDVSPFWLGDPGVRNSDSKSHARSGIPVNLPVDRPKPHDSSLAVAPTTGSNPSRPANSRPHGHPDGSFTFGCPGGPPGARVPVGVPRVRPPRRVVSRLGTRGVPRVRPPRRVVSRLVTRWVSLRPVAPKSFLALGHPVGFLASGHPEGSPRARSPEQGIREPDHPEGSSGARPPRRAAGLPLSATLMEFPSPSTRKPRRVHSTPVCLTGYVPSTGFLTLSTVSASPERPALFHAGNAHGVFCPSGVFPHRQVPTTRRLGIALLTFLHRTGDSSTRGVRQFTPKRAYRTFAASRALLRR